MLSEWISRERIARGWTQEELAQRVHTSAGYIQHLEAGRRVPGRRALTGLADAFDVSVDALLKEFTGDPIDEPPVAILRRAGLWSEKDLARFATLWPGFSVSIRIGHWKRARIIQADTETLKAIQELKAELDYSDHLLEGEDEVEPPVKPPVDDGEPRIASGQ